MTNTTLALCAIVLGSSFIVGCAADDTSSEQSIPRVSSGSSKSDSSSDDVPSKTTPAKSNGTTATNAPSSAAPAAAPGDDDAQQIPAKDAPIVTPDPAAPVAPQQLVAMTCHDDEDSITASYKIALLRAPDSAGLSYYVLQVQSGAQSRLDVLRNMVNSDEFVTQRAGLTDDQFVTSLYTGFLARQPDAAGKAFWVGKLASGVTRTNVATSFVDSNEFADPNSNKQAACFF